MIRPFEPPDARRLKPNEFSDIHDLGFIFSDDSFYKHTLVDDESNVQCIICFKQYWERNYVALFLISKDFKPSLAKQLKRFVHQAIEDLGAERVQTDSVDCPLLNKWHEFLQFKCEGIRKKMIYGKDFRSWAWVR